MMKDKMSFLDEMLKASEPVLGISINKRDDLAKIAYDITGEHNFIHYSILCDMVRKAEKTQTVVEQEINGVTVCAYPVVRF